MFKEAMTFFERGYLTKEIPHRYPLAYGPEGVTLEGRKMAMAGKQGSVN